MGKWRTCHVVWWFVTLFCFASADASGYVDYEDINSETTWLNEVINSSEINHDNTTEADGCDCGENSTDCKFEDGQKVCSCEPGYLVGNYGFCSRPCQKHADCFHGGYCLEQFVLFCLCLPGTHGDHCEIIDDCVNNSTKCGTGTDVECAYDEKYNIAYCRCGQGRRFDVPQKKCVDQNICNEDKECSNDGQCEGEGKMKYCKCKTGTSGDFCERIEECLDKPTLCGNGSDVECRFNYLIGRAYCHCLNGTQRFDLPQKKCVERKTCIGYEDCQSWGKCSNKCLYYEPCDNSDYFEGISTCHCMAGASGDHCRLKDDCYTKEVDCGKGGNVTCVLTDTDEGYSVEAFCKCHDKMQAFDAESKLCKDCDCGPKSEYCYFENGKKKCECEYNYYSTDDTCEYCNCGNNSDGCMFKDGKIQCLCRYGYFMKDGTCEDCKCGRGYKGCTITDGKKSCICSVGSSLNNGMCKRCYCGEGSDYCTFTDGKKQCHCESGYSLNNGICQQCDCGGNSTNCTFENGRKVCSCQHEFAAGDYGFCKPICSDSNKCKNGGLCLQDVCVCLAGTGGTFCEIVYDCEEKKCGDTWSSVCKYDTHNQKAYCECLYKNDKFDPYDKSCKWCNCGDHSTCDFDSDGKQVCHCNKGFKEKEGRCYECDCGNYGTCIGFDKLYVDNINVCVCRPGYENFEGTCVECNCGYYGTCIGFDKHYSGRRNLCVCKPGHEDSNGTCLECPCGEHGNCVYSSSGGFDKCNCDAGYAEYLRKCKYCDCGLYSNCKFDGGVKVCDCPIGYEDPGHGYCIAMYPIPWKIGYGLLSGGFIIIIICLACMIFKIRKNSVQKQTDISLDRF